MFHRPKPGEDWGPVIGECEVCGAPVYASDYGTCACCGSDIEGKGGNGED